MFGYIYFIKFKTWLESNTDNADVFIRKGAKPPGCKASTKNI